ncbi:cytosolic glyceraldehyde-3-phosphate dehydrogenase [Vairimorpha apis BRL 01]|uniref:glyceraldehyde-3-phosphate dehydrogenase (phosphorylating) n=1 Tax=Vairimorpha apis BRL 01 TaxID=1037528 RepID=T0L8F4_9MICR|nr:cytosolic glyceraldehyde-3-phosphate dehydrogenase [Vairimorpha apis BRL 01]
MGFKVGINGFGRIGKLVYKILRERDIEVPIVNDPALDVSYMYYLLKYDSVFGFDEKVKLKNNQVYYKDKLSELTAFKNPSDIPWKQYDVDYVVEATGIFKTISECEKHRNVKNVIITAPSDDAPMFAVGKIIPELNGKLNGMSMRVPLPDVSVVDLTVRLSKPTSLDEIKKVMIEEGKINKNIIGVTEEDVVSTDFIKDKRSCIFDYKASMQMGENFFKLIAQFRYIYFKYKKILPYLNLIKDHISSIDVNFDLYHVKLDRLANEINDIEAENTKLENEILYQKQIYSKLKELLINLEIKEDHFINLETESFDTSEGITKIEQSLDVLNSFNIENYTIRVVKEKKNVLIKNNKDKDNIYEAVNNKRRLFKIKKFCSNLDEYQNIVKEIDDNFARHVIDFILETDHPVSQTKKLFQFITGQEQFVKNLKEDIYEIIEDNLSDKEKNEISKFM